MRHALVRGGIVAAMMVGSTMWAWPASAGGGCHEGATQGEGDTVAMADLCFTPSVLRVDPGTEVTFVNRDLTTHNVSANGWGHFEDMAKGDGFRATFEEEGVYPYACMYHAGMTGAVVVGDGAGAGSGAPVTVAPLTTAAQEASSQSSKASAPAATAGDGTSAVGWAIGGAGGFVIGAAAAMMVRRRRLTTD
ncbi:MAG TPA: plastocyanin/azurin family copper-binding protein [Actinomycetota bacterium]|nr:plastocyanin/azurin family copper-binding protein [Actinomycetota bacterium]